jgi:hypothetical protein
MAFQSKLKSLVPRREQFQRRIKLLSNGYTCPKAFPNGEITVYPWDTHVDDWLAARIKKGDQHMVLYDLCAQVADLNGCPLENFVIGDVNTVLLVSRSIRHNSVVEYEAQCPACGYKTVETINVPNELGRVGEKFDGYLGYDQIVLPDCEDVVHIRPLTVRDEKFIAERDDSSKALMTDHIMHILMPIVSINDGKPDAWEQVLTWFNAISPRDAAYLEAKENELYPHLDTDIPHRCDKCQTEFRHELDFSREFFRPSVKPGKGAPVSNAVRPGNEQQGTGSDSERNSGSVP